MIPYNKQTIEQDDIDAVTVALKSDRLTGGPIVARFEEDLAEYLNYSYVAVVSSGTAALDAVYRWLAQSGEFKVTTTPLTYLATSSAAHRGGGEFFDLRYEDIDAQTLNMQIPVSNEHRIILPIDFGGLPCVDFDRPSENIVIVDSSHSIGAKLSNVPYARTFSFHPVKNITTGEGGAVATHDRDLYEFVKAFRDNGRINFDDSRFVGTSYRLSTINAALGSSQLKKIDRFVSRRREIAARYHMELPDCLRLPYWSDDHGWHLYVIRHSRRDEIKRRLADCDIEAVINYRLVYTHTFAKYLRPDKTLTNAEIASKEVLSIPIFPTLTNEMQAFVIASLSKICKELKL